MASVNRPNNLKKALVCAQPPTVLYILLLYVSWLFHDNFLSLDWGKRKGTLGPHSIDNKFNDNTTQCEQPCANEEERKSIATLTNYWNNATKTVKCSTTCALHDNHWAEYTVPLVSFNCTVTFNHHVSLLRKVTMTSILLILEIIGA